VGASRSPLDPHAATPHELVERRRAEARGPVLVYRDGGDRQIVVELADARNRVTIGRAGQADISLDWDPKVSRLHAALERIGDSWVLVDDGLSRNGTAINGQRVDGRRRLRDGDVLLVGGVAIAYRAPDGPTVAGGTQTSDGGAAQALTPTQRRVLVALCRPCRDGGFAVPASNPEIAAELTVSVEAVRTTMRALFERFGIDDLPQNRKRAALAAQALRTGAVTRRELADGPQA
jgi:pSer/pThr/pTyr-binding forkhead associated (FHA) protein